MNVPAAVPLNARAPVESAATPMASVVFDFTVPSPHGEAPLALSSGLETSRRVVRPAAGSTQTPGFACRAGLIGVVRAGDDSAAVTVESPALFLQPDGHEHNLEFLLSLRRAHLAECRRALESLISDCGVRNADLGREAA
jgi:hypothetical protein